MLTDGEGEMTRPRNWSWRPLSPPALRRGSSSDNLSESVRWREEGVDGQQDHDDPDPTTGSGVSRDVTSALRGADPAARPTEAGVRPPDSRVGIRAHGYVMRARSLGRLRSSPRATP